MAELRRGLHRPLRVAQDFAAEQDHVGLAAADDVIGLGRRGDQADGRAGNVRLAAHAFGEFGLEAGPAGIFASGRMPPVETLIRSTPCVFSTRHRAAVSSGVQPPSIQSVADRAHDQRQPLRPHHAYRIDDVEGKPRAVGEAAAVAVGAPVGERRKELVQQVAVRGMDLDRGNPAACARRAASANRPASAPMPSASSSTGTACALENGIGDGATTGQPPSLAGIDAAGSQPRPTLAFLPAWASCTAIGQPCSWAKRTMRARGSI